jgi:AcrR family transcriptional regulator
MSETTTPARTRAPRLPAEERRRQILAAAISVFARLGYAGTGTADIAAAAGIGEPTIYRYFTNKRDVFVGAIRHASEEVRDEWQGIADAAPDALTALAQIGVWYYRQMQQHPEALMLRSRATVEAPDPDALAIVREEYRQTLRFIESLFNRAKGDGLLDADADTRTLTWMFMSVGALLDMTQLLDLGDELGPGEVARLAALLQNARSD